MENNRKNKILCFFALAEKQSCYGNKITKAQLKRVKTGILVPIVMAIM
jgi:hypothetical protein